MGAAGSIGIDTDDYVLKLEDIHEILNQINNSSLLNYEQRFCDLNQDVGTIRTVLENQQIFSKFLIEKCEIDNKLHQRQLYIQFSYRLKMLPPIRIIDFDNFKSIGEFPRYPENQSICEELSQINRNECFIVFISHCWLRGYPLAEGWNGRPHPDNATHEKYKLCVNGIGKAFKSLAPGMKKCYVWLDFGCMNQDSAPANELKQLDELIRVSDIIFTPVFDKEWNLRQFPTGLGNGYAEYPSAAWCTAPYGYVSRGWCRVEMFYAANISTQNDASRLDKFAAGLKQMASYNVRPHLLYGSREGDSGRQPLILPPLQNSYFDMLHPSKGSLTVTTDVVIIDQLVQDLLPYMKRTVEGYEGERNEKGERHGKGIQRFANGDRYEGEWFNDKKHNRGTFYYSHGDQYDGEWVDDQKNGYGIGYYGFGHRYEGEWKDQLRNGRGTFYYADGSQYVGEWKDSVRCGKGIMYFVEGNRYEGDWKDNKMHGMGIMYSVNGEVYEGEFELDKPNGKGIYSQNS